MNIEAISDFGREKGLNRAPAAVSGSAASRKSCNQFFVLEVDLDFCHFLRSLIPIHIPLHMAMCVLMIEEANPGDYIGSAAEAIRRVGDGITG